MLLLELLARIVRQRLLAAGRFELRIGLLRADQIEVVATRKRVGTKLLSFKGRHSSTISLEVVVVRESEVERADRRRPRQEPDAEPGDDAEIRLGEQAVQDRPEAVFRDVPVGDVGMVERPSPVRRTSPLPSTTSMPQEKPKWSSGPIARALVHGVAEHAALGRARGRRDHEVAAAPDELVGHGLKADAGLDRGEGELLVDLEDRFMRRPRSTTISPACTGARVPSPMLLPVETGKSGVSCALAARTTACTSAVEPG